MGAVWFLGRSSLCVRGMRKLDMIISVPCKAVGYWFLRRPAAFLFSVYWVAGGLSFWRIDSAVLI